MNKENLILTCNCEDIFKEIFNMVYSLNLVNLNSIQNNYPAIYLGDKGKRISIQITSSNTKKKIDDTIQKFEKKLLFNSYKELWIFILGDKVKKQDIDSNNKYILKIMDISDLIEDILSLEINSLKQINNFINENISSMKSNSISEDENKLNSIKKLLDNLEIIDVIENEDFIGGFDADIFDNIDRIDMFINKRKIL